MSNKDTKFSRAVQISSFDLDLLHDRITAYAVVNKKPKDFSINQQDFETWVDLHELRNWNQDTYTGWSGWTEDNGTYDWDDIYSGSLDLPFAFLEVLLKSYVQDLYDQESMNIEAPLKQILSTFKNAGV